jgi:DNA-binding beta-propeller fold protein YncE
MLPGLELSWSRILRQVFLVLVLAGCSFKLNPNELKASTIQLTDTPRAVSFDDMSFDQKMGAVIIPAAETGKLLLVKPDTLAVKAISGFSQKAQSVGAVSGSTSATTGRGFIFALDRGALKIDVIDPAVGQIITSAPVAAAPDYIRYVTARNELWVTEKAASQIEIFGLPDGDPFTPFSTGVIPVPNGPEGLLIDRIRGLAYTNQPKSGTTAVIQVQTHGIIAEWGNGCSKARGMAIDEQQGYLFVACNEGKVVIMDVKNNGQQLASQNFGAGIDFVAYNPRLQHLYMPSGTSAILAVFGVVETPAAASASTAGSTPAALDATAVPKVSLVRLGTADTAVKARCVTADDQDNIWVCDPAQGGVFVIKDTFPASGKP